MPVSLSEKRSTPIQYLVYDISCSASPTSKTRALILAFFDYLRQAKAVNQAPWLLCGDFNVTTKFEERSKQHGDWRGTSSFAQLINFAGLGVYKEDSTLGKMQDIGPH